MIRWRWVASLRFRWLAATLVALVLAMALAGVMLAGLFREHAMRQFEASLLGHLNQITGHLEFDAAGQPRIDLQALSDPRWQRPYSGQYWQIDALADSGWRTGVLRSRSLWDAVLPVQSDALADGTIHLHDATGPDGEPLRLIERIVHAQGSAQRWRLVVASNTRALAEAESRFTASLAASLAVLLALLAFAAVAQVAVGLAPLRAMQRALAAVREGRTQRLQGRFPVEVQPLIDEFNGVLDRNAEIVARARAQAGNLAHAVKTPLAAMAQGAEAAAGQPQAAADLAPLVREQVALARRHIDWHLARSRAAAAQGMPGVRAPLAPLVRGLLRVLERAHAERELTLVSDPIDPGWAFAGEEQDLQEILGNLLDNACKWARTQVRIAVSIEAAGRGRRLCIVIDDDGPGIDASQRDAVMARGARIDESVPGSGLGLSIVRELVGLYGGTIALETGPLGGLRVVLRLPATGG